MSDIVNGVEVGAACKDCGVVLIDEKHVIREYPYVIDGDSICGACRDKRLMIARRYGKKIDAGEVHPEVKKAVEESNAKKETKEKPEEDESKKKETDESVPSNDKKKVAKKKTKKK